MQDPTDNVRERRFDVDQNFDGWRLDQFLADRIPRLTRTRAGEIAKFGDVRVEPHRKVKAGTKLRAGDVVIVREHLAPETLSDDAVTILWEDDRLLALNKPPFMLVHETASVRQNTVQGFLHRNGFENGEPAHRLDRETSGVLICGKDKEAVIALRTMFAEQHPEKIYRAIVVDPDVFWREPETITIPLGIVPNATVRLRMGRGDLACKTSVRPLRFSDGLTDLEVEIETGRQHQIRVHLALKGTPVAGDKLYTYDDEFFIAITDHPDDVELNERLPFGRHALHAWRLRFAHPFSGEEILVEAPLPDAWDLFT